MCYVLGIGLCHEYGWGVPVDMEVAAEHYSKAALDGNASAMYNLATYFEKTAANGRPLFFIVFLCTKVDQQIHTISIYLKNCLYSTIIMTTLKQP